MRLIGDVTQAMTEQATASNQVARAVGDMRRQSGQVAQAIGQQSRATKDITVATEHVSKQMALITRANREHSAAGEAILRALVDIRAVADRNAQGAQESRRATDGLQERTAAVVAIANRLGRAGSPPRPPKGGKK